ncbi:Uncharacterised protein [Legionella pneumophila]|nr:Uncharacterised protein [Legionella pneumophila]CZI01638.1 Uncharacterised protein [Legionella pneumophila]CZR16242.1 Uncharacterised protein [Legionella pneumophila]STX82694.1 Uncharacterised protein [Legionella pneumophila]VEB29724.1 Uncharacterised protein [Legionella pneumophila]
MFINNQDWTNFISLIKIKNINLIEVPQHGEHVIIKI